MQSGSPGGFTSVPATGSPSAVSNVTVSAYGAKPVNGGRFDFDDGGTYCGGWEDGKAHGHGVCTGPKGQGEYSGSWHFGFEVSGVYTWPSGSTFEGQWQNGKRHGLGTEYRGRWTYRGEWTQGFKGRYGVRQATASNAKYEGTWANGLQDGYGSETYADGGTFQGQWLRGLRHGYGVRTSAPFGMASHFRPKAPQGSLVSLKSDAAGEPTSERDRRIDDVRGGFVLRTRSDEPPARRKSLVERSSNFKESILKGLKLRKQRSTGDIDKKGTNTSIRSTHSSASWMSNDSGQSGVTSGSHHTDSNASFIVEDEHMDTNVTETYMGEWKNDKRSGFGISERSDGLKYEGEWYNNKKYGYGVTTFKDGTKEEGKYKNNVLITSQKKKHLFLMRSAKFRERIDAAVNAAQRASKIALQKADIAISRTATARGKAEQADIGAAHAREDSEIARITAKQFAPDFHQPGTEALKPQRNHRHHTPIIPDLSNKIGATRNDEQSRAMQYNKAPGTREQSLEPNYNEPPNYRHQHQQMNPPAFSQNNPHSDQLTSDRLDRNSLINQPIDRIDGSQYTQQLQQQQQPYMNRHGEVPTGGLYQSEGARPMSHQNMMDINGPMDSMTNKPQMGNSIMHSKGGMMAGTPNSSSAAAARNSTMDPHSHQIHAQMPTSTSMDSGFDQRGRETSRRSHLPQSRQNNPNASSAYNYQQAMSDHFDHYKRAPSRDSSVDRFGGRTRSRTRAPTPEVGPAPPANPHSRAPSATRQRTPFGDQPPATGMIRASTANLDTMIGMDQGPMRRGDTPARTSGKDSPAHGLSDAGSVFGGGSDIDELILRKKGLGQEIPPVPYTPKRTESLFLKSAIPKASPGPSSSMASGGGGGGVPVKRKKSLPDSVTLPKAVQGMTREEVSYLGSARRQEVRRMQDDAERLRANPLLYLLNPNIKNWFSRQRLMVLVLFINLSLAIMFLQLLT